MISCRLLFSIGYIMNKRRLESESDQLTISPVRKCFENAQLYFTAVVQEIQKKAHDQRSEELARQVLANVERGNSFFDEGARKYQKTCIQACEKAETLAELANFLKTINDGTIPSEEAAKQAQAEAEEATKKLTEAAKNHMSAQPN